MSESTGRQEMQRRLIEKSLQDAAFRQRLLSDPKAAVEQELGTSLPEDVRVVALEETADTIYLVLPSVSRVGEGEELSDRDLGAVAGGAPAVGTASGDTCNTAACWGITCPDPSECG